MFLSQFWVFIPNSITGSKVVFCFSNQIRIETPNLVKFGTRIIQLKQIQPNVKRTEFKFIQAKTTTLVMLINYIV
jgi:hypothetical protein